MWTKEQLEAIHITGVNTTVSASAGAGKTAVLVERLMKRILVDKISVDKIVSLTFTDAAAAEMKNRLMSSLLEAYKKDPNNTYLYDQITLLPSAQITTIHSFCLNILKNHYYALNINPDSLNNILSESEDLRLQQEAFNQVLKQFDKVKSTQILQLISASALSLEKLNKMMHEFSLKANSTINPDQFLRDSIKIYDHFEELNDLPEPHLSLFWTFHKHHILSLKKHLNNAYRELDFVDEGKNTDKQRAWIQEALISLQQCEEAIETRNYTLYYRCLLDCASIENTVVRSEPKYKKQRDAFYDTLTQVSSILYTQQQLLDHLALNADILKDLIEMTILYNNIYKNSIKAANRITFNDMETLTYELLTLNDQEIAKILRTEISDILVDEFQDTNQLQNEIITLISNGHNVFRVGDIKQSIYRFRGAEPTIMQALITQENSEHHQTIYLSNNFRSKHSIVEYNNHVFDKLMNLELFNSAYTDSDWVKVGVDTQKEESVPVELHRIDVSQNEHLKGYSKHDYKAHYIANKIIELYQQDTEKRWNRFTVLVSSHNRKLELKKAFDAANIPYFISMPDGLYTSDGVSVLHAYLKCVYDPQDMISLMALLKNLYGYSDDEITELYLKHHDLKRVAKVLAKDLYSDLYYFNKRQSDIRISEIINHVLSINDFYEQKLTNQQRVNVDIFYDTVLNYDKTQRGVYGLLKDIELSLDAKSKEGSSISSEDNVVNVMTIHNSKGLQFETVFLMSKDTRKNAGDPTYLLHPTYGLAMPSLDLKTRIKYQNIPYTVIRYFDKLEAVEEDMRTLYVALTRAQKQLYIVDVTKSKDDEIPESESLDDQLVLSSSYTKWLESTHRSHPTLHLKSLIIGELETLRMTEDKVSNTDIKHFKETVNKHEEPKTHFTIDTFSFDQAQMGSDIGTLVHHTLERLPKAPWTYAQIKALNKDLSDYYIKRLLNLSHNSFFISLQDSTIYKEYPFIIQKDGLRQRGIIDYLIKQDDTLIIIDFKTDALENTHEFRDRYHDQLIFYKEALKLHAPDKNVEAYIYSFKLETFIPIE